jgi:hypothetical protein
MFRSTHEHTQKKSSYIFKVNTPTRGKRMFTSWLIWWTRPPKLWCARTMLHKNKMCNSRWSRDMLMWETTQRVIFVWRKNKRKHGNFFIWTPPSDPCSLNCAPNAVHRPNLNENRGENIFRNHMQWSHHKYLIWPIGSTPISKRDLTIKETGLEAWK